MNKRFSRTEALIGPEAIKKLAGSTIAVFGAGGVGSYAIEALARASIGTIIIIDSAEVDESNINRQIIALDSTIGMSKTHVAENRVRDINPEIIVRTFSDFADSDTIPGMIPAETDYIIDAIDSVSSKLSLIEYAAQNGIPIISCMGTGNKIHPQKMRVSDVFKTSVDPLARVMRRELKKRGIKKLKVVWSDEIPYISGDQLPTNSDGKKVPASISFVPATAGLLLASEVIIDISGLK